MNMERNNTVTIGANNNDFEMLKSAGFLAAMHDAPKELRDICDFAVCTSKDGTVNAVIEHLMRKNDWTHLDSLMKLSK